MTKVFSSAGGGSSSDGADQTGPIATLRGGFRPSVVAGTSTMSSRPELPMRAGSIQMPELIEFYMTHYAGRDPTRLHRLGWRRRLIPALGQSVRKQINDSETELLEVIAELEKRVSYLEGQL